MELMVKQGYKQTEVGLIPEDWNVYRFEDLGDTIIGLTYKPVDVNITGKLVHRSSNIQNNKLAYHDNVYVTCHVPEKLILRKDDILICVRNGSRDLIGKSAIIQGISIGETFGAFMSVFRPRIYPPLVYQYFISNIVQSQINASLGATINQITNKTLNSFITVFPTNLSEQKAIATALSDVDELIANLDKLITKKKAIKQGAMQQLLTPPHKGGKRLEGFSGDWEEKKLGEFCKITTGKLDANAMVLDGDYRFYTCAKNFYFIDKYAFDTEALLISGNGANVGYIHYYKGKFNAYQRTYVLDEFSTDIKFMKCLLDKYLALRIDSEKNEGNTPYIKMDTLTEMVITLPFNIEEQKAIAEILLDMDVVIEQLEAKKAKHQNIKQGMMQELLIGKTRLI